MALAFQAGWSWRLVLLLAITCLAEAMYFLALGRAYRFAIWSALFFGDVLSAPGWIGIVICVGGVLWLGASAWGGEPAKALPWAAVAALATSVYSTSNKLAVTALPGYAVQLGYVSVALIVAWIALSIENRRHTGYFVPRTMPHPLKWIVAGICIGNAYALVIFAMQFISAAYAIAFTNAGIVLAGLISMTVYAERQRWPARLAAMLVVCAGPALLAIA